MRNPTRVCVLLLTAITLVIFLWKEQFFYALFLAFFLLLFEQLPRLTSVKLNRNQFEIKLSEKLGAVKAKEVEVRLESAIKAFETKSGHELTDGAKKYIYDVVREGFVERQSELLERYGIDLKDRSQIDAAIAKTIASLETVLGEARPTKSNKITISKFSEPIKGNWCEVFPFCG